MSGGYFHYCDHWCSLLADDIDKLIAVNDSNECYSFTSVTLDKFREAIVTLRKAQIMIRRIDWLVSGDDGEETFHERWDEDMKRLDSLLSTPSDDNDDTFSDRWHRHGGK